MKQIYLVFYLTVFYATDSWSQPYFEQIYNLTLDADGGHEIYRDVHLQRYVLTNLTTQGGMGVNPALTIVDSNGTELYSTILGFPAPSEIRRVVASPDGNYLACGHETNAQGEFEPFVLKLDTTGNVIWKRYYVVTEEKFSLKLVPELEGNYYLLLYNRLPSTLVNTFLFKIDADGDTLWRRELQLSSAVGVRGSDMVLMPNGDLMLTFDQELVGVNGFAKAVAMRLNAWGDILWSRDLSVRDRQEAPFNPTLAVHPDGGVVSSYLFLTELFDQPIAGDNRNIIYRINDNGQVLWHYIFFNQARRGRLENLIVDAEGNTYGCGYSPKSDDLGGYGWIFKLDRHGELLWERYYSSTIENAINLVGFRAIELAFSGGLLALGSLHLPDGAVWLVGLDADGCFTPDCAQEYVVLTPVREPKAPMLRTAWLRAWPNPAPDALHVELLQAPPAGARLRMFNWQGQEVSRPDLESGVSALTIDLANLPAGLYLLSLEAGGRVLHTQKVVKG